MSADYISYAGPAVLVRHQPGTPTAHEVQDAIREQLCHVWGHPILEDCSLWIPNVRRDPPRKFLGHPKQEQVYHELLSGDLISERRWFEQAFFSEIRHLEQVYGAEYVMIRWCVLSLIR